jgi:hypothetical protein
MFFTVACPGEIVKGVGVDFANSLATGETVSSGAVTCTTAGIVSSITTSGSQVICTLTAPTGIGEYPIIFNAVGSLGSKPYSKLLFCVREDRIT